MYAFRLAEEQIYFALVDGLNEVSYVLTLEACGGKGLIFAVDRIEHHLAYAFLEFIDVIEEDFQVAGMYVGGCNHKQHVKDGGRGLRVRL